MNHSTDLKTRGSFGWWTSIVPRRDDHNRLSGFWISAIRLGQVWAEADRKTDFETVISDLLTGQYKILFALLVSAQ
jgi:hypothetical protein